MAPAKHVRFQEPAEGSPGISTPSPTYSSASLESNSPLTPPHYSLPPPNVYLSPPQIPFPHDHFGSPFGFGSPRLPLSPPPAPVRIHPLLSPSPQPLPLAWDLRQPMETASAFVLPSRTYELLEPYQLSIPATDPPLPSLTIVSEFLGWPIVINPREGAHSSPRNYVGVSVGDVLRGLYRALRTPVHSVELAALGEAKQRAMNACIERCVGNKAEAQKGMKRVDFLFEARAFAGLQMVIGAPVKGRVPGEVWALKVVVLQ